MRVGVFGGTFDPVHYGHLILAEQCREQGRLDEILFVPAPRPPHKPRPCARFEQRVEMLALALAGNAAFRIEEVEKERDGPSYTVDTLVELRKRRPNDELLLLVGADTIRDLPQWSPAFLSWEGRKALPLTVRSFAPGSACPSTQCVWR
jgi:nicotinate-nucleotide adenylyltransferase